MSERRSDYYGWVHAEIDDVAREIGQALGVELEPRESLYLGEYYRWKGPDDSDITLQENFIEDDDGLPTDNEHPDHVVLLTFFGLPGEWSERLAHLPGAERLGP